MGPIEGDPNYSPMKLLPYQNAFVETFFNPASKRVILLHGDVGLGKTTTLIALSSRLLHERPTARVLFLVSKGPQAQLVEMLRDAGAPALLVDRYQFREMLDSITNKEFWPRGMVAVLSRDFAKQADILNSLAEAHWDLVIADEAHWFKGARAEILRRVGASATRVVLATATPLDLELPDAHLAEEATVVEWRRDRVVDHDGTPLGIWPPTQVQEVSFSLSPSELSLLETVRSLCRILEASGPPRGRAAKSLLHSFQSSPAALEGALQRLIKRLMEQESVDPLLESLDEDVLEDEPNGRVDRLRAEEATEIGARALQEIEKLSSDSKLGTLAGLLSHLNEVKMPSRRICILTDHLSTLYYLASGIEGCGLPRHLLHGGMSVEDRRRSVTLFLSEGGILVATRAVIDESFALGQVTDLVLYDVPSSPVALQLVLGRFHWFGRVTQLNIYVLAPSGNARSLASESLRLLGETLGSVTGGCLGSPRSNAGRVAPAVELKATRERRGHPIL